VIRAKVGQDEIVLRTTSRLAGAIDSLTFRGQEYVDSHDHGRQFQSALALHQGDRKDFWAECYNPTEAGSRADGIGNTSSSKLVKLTTSDTTMSSTTQMAFWLAPGEKSFGRPARNSKTLSDCLLTKTIRLGTKLSPQILDYQTTFTLPESEQATYAQFESLTGYMPPQFQKFWRYDRIKQNLEPLSDGPGEQADPVAFSTEDGQHALAIYSPDQPSRGYEQAGYGRFRFETEKVVKWNCVFRVSDPKRVPSGEYRFPHFVILGTRAEVLDLLKKVVPAKPR
jgi:hypothetical protein